MSKSKLVKLFKRERKIGHVSLLERLVKLLTFAKLRRVTITAWNSFFEFRTPAWSNAAKRVYTPSKKLNWFDFFNPIYWLVWILSFLYQWIISRPYLSLGPAIPAIASLFLVIGVVVRQRVESRQMQLRFYESTLDDATRDKDYGLARIALLSLIRRSPDSERFQVRQALLDFETDRKEEAIRSMFRLALNNSNSSAAVWLLTRYYTQLKVSDWTPADHTQFKRLYPIAVADAKGDVETSLRLLMANYLTSQGAVSDAASSLAQLTARNADLHLPTAVAYLQAGNQDSAVFYAEQAERHYTTRLSKEPEDITARLNLARALIIRREEQRAVQSLSDGYKLTSDPQLLDAGGEALVAWSNRIKTSEPATPINLVRRMELLVQASKVAARNGVVAEALTQAAVECASNSDKQVQTLRQALLRGISPSSVHFVTGTVELLNGDIEKANMHLEQAAKDNANLPGLLNNMAVAMYQMDNPQLDRALTLVNAALERLPNHPYIRETRGQILLRMKKYQDAIRDLEFAVGVQELAKNVHLSLVDAYTSIGQADLAEEHRQLAATK